MRILIVTALKYELQPIKQYLHNQFMSDDFTKISYLVTGIGKENAIKKLSEHLKTNFYEIVINAGSAGSLNTNYIVGDVFFPERYIAKIDGKIKYIQCEYINKSFIPKKWKKGDLFTSDQSIMTNEQKEKLKKISNSEAVDMETFFLAGCCKNMGIPFISIKIISDLAENLTIAKFKNQLKVVINLLLEPIKILINNLEI